MTEWTKAEDEVLRHFAKLKLSYSAAALALGRSRNAVAGRCHRLGVRFMIGLAEKNKRRGDLVMDAIRNDPEKMERFRSAVSRGMTASHARRAARTR